VLAHVNKKSLYRLSWGAKNARGEKWEKYSRDFDERFREMTAELMQSPWLDLKILYGYWPVQSSGKNLLIYEPKGNQPFTKKEIARFSFPRQNGKDGKCLVDYFINEKSGKLDTCAFQVVTVGQHAIDHINRLYEKSDLSEAYYAHGLAVAITEALAETGHAIIRSKLKLPARQGKRFSWGYPALPDLSQHEILFSFLPAEKELGLRLTSAFQISPELSTAAMIVHHPQASYLTMH
jgi:5-methyltetrahydrofolate--homocysteine methyltransferase